jgi:hypothetical protein
MKKVTHSVSGCKFLVVRPFLMKLEKNWNLGKEFALFFSSKRKFALANERTIKGLE